MTDDYWGHIDATKKFIAEATSWERVLPDDASKWPSRAKMKPHLVLYIEVWVDANYYNSGIGVGGTSFCYWRFKNHAHALDDNAGFLTLESYKRFGGLDMGRHHRKMQGQWEWEHDQDNFEYDPTTEARLLAQMEQLGYVDLSTTEVEMTTFNIDSIEHYISEADISCLHGIYRSAPGSHSSCGRYQFGVVDMEGEPTAIITKDAEISGYEWKVGEVKSRFVRTASPTIFIAEWKMANHTETEGYATCEGGLLTLELPELSGENTEPVSCNFIKTYPLAAVTNSNSVVVSVNVGDAISAGSAVVIDESNQFIVTNFHVVKDRTSFKVEQGGTLHEALLLKTDEKNDLALLRIISENIRLKALAISMDDGLGDRVYSAGYPRVFQMGDDIKVTEGVISSMSFLSDPSRFQTSVPITNGNSGGALLDESGNLVGITQGGWRPDANTENVNAAVKSLYVVSLAQTEATCEPSLVQKKGKLDFSEIENSVLPIFVFD